MEMPVFTLDANELGLHGLVLHNYDRGPMDNPGGFSLMEVALDNGYTFVECGD